MNILNRLDNISIPHSILITCSDTDNIRNDVLKDIKFLLCNSDLECTGCNSCKVFDGENIHPDFVKLDPLNSSVAINDIRELVAFSRYKPSISKIKVILIENVDKLNLASSNALLKTLEEPVDFQHFILTTSNEHDILPTIMSRCTKIRLSSEQTPYDSRDKNLISSLEGIIIGVNSNDSLIISRCLDSLKGGEIDKILESLHYLMFDLVSGFSDYHKKALSYIGLTKAFDIASWSLNMRKSSNSTKFNEELFFDQLLQKLSGEQNGGRRKSG
jgi:hypothetical protein